MHPTGPLSMRRSSCWTLYTCAVVRAALHESLRGVVVGCSTSSRHALQWVIIQTIISGLNAWLIRSSMKLKGLQWLRVVGSCCNCHAHQSLVSCGPNKQHSCQLDIIAIAHQTRVVPPVSICSAAKCHNNVRWTTHACEHTSTPQLTTHHLSFARTT